MKRSRIFLGGTSVFLAVIGLAATKAKQFHDVTVYYYTQSSNPQNCPFAIKEFCTVAGSGCTISIPLKGVFPVYRSRAQVGVSDVVCSTTLNTSGI